MAIDFSKHPKAQELIEKTGLQDQSDRVVWTQYSREDAATLLAEMYFLCYAGLTNNINLRQRAKRGFHYYSNQITANVHAFAKRQAIADLGLTPQQVLDFNPNNIWRATE